MPGDEKVGTESVYSASIRADRLFFPATRCIRKKSHFSYVYENSRKIENHLVRVYVATARDSVGKVALIASKKVGNAVIRNRCRRRLKEIIRQYQHQIDPSTDFIIVSKPRMAVESFQSLQRQVVSLLHRYGFWTSCDQTPHLISY